ncbi:MAG TPA: NUDIX domain-containing protein [Longimicrobium sp.]|nr:NUDIX domain-containing protein [Longimicrobium sp.]
MAMSPYLRALREHVGPMRLLLPSVSAHLFDADGRLLLVRQRELDVWSTPGGMIEPDERPADAVVREVWEETGQQVTGLAAVGVSSAHWLGRSPRGRLEDFHAVRVLFEAWCPRPGDPVVHDAGGTTLAAAWVRAGELPALPMTDGWRGMLAELVR